MKKLLLLIVITALFASCGSTKKTRRSDVAGKQPQEQMQASPRDFEEFMESHRVYVEREYVNPMTFVVSEYSNDPTYGYTEGNPVKVGGVSEGPVNERRFLNALAGPNGERIAYRRRGSCCPFDTPNSPFSRGMLDAYEVFIDGKADPVIIYINMYDADELKIPVGFTRKRFDITPIT